MYAVFTVLDYETKGIEESVYLFDDDQSAQNWIIDRLIENKLIIEIGSGYLLLDNGKPERDFFANKLEVIEAFQECKLGFLEFLHIFDVNSSFLSANKVPAGEQRLDLATSILLKTLPDNFVANRESLKTRARDCFALADAMLEARGNGEENE